MKSLGYNACNAIRYQVGFDPHVHHYFVTQLVINQFLVIREQPRMSGRA